MISSVTFGKYFASVPRYSCWAASSVFQVEHLNPPGPGGQDFQVRRLQDEALPARSLDTAWHHSHAQVDVHCRRWPAGRLRNAAARVHDRRWCFYRKRKIFPWPRRIHKGLVKFDVEPWLYKHVDPARPTPCLLLHSATANVSSDDARAKVLQHATTNGPGVCDGRTVDST